MDVDKIKTLKDLIAKVEKVKSDIITAEKQISDPDLAVPMILASENCSRVVMSLQVAIIRCEDKNKKAHDSINSQE